MTSIPESRQRSKKTKGLGPVGVIRPEQYGAFDVNSKLECIQRPYPLEPDAYSRAFRGRGARFGRGPVCAEVFASARPPSWEQYGQCAAGGSTASVPDPSHPARVRGRDLLSKPGPPPGPGKRDEVLLMRVFGTSDNAVTSQIWIAVSVSLLIAFVKKRLQLDASSYTLLQILSVTLFEKMPLPQAFSHGDTRSDIMTTLNQLNSFEF